jgi:hypothetical protein
MDIGTVLLMLGVAYGLGLLWYDLLPAKLPERVWRVAAYPFLGIFVAEAVLAPALSFDPKFGGVHLLSALIGSLVGVIVDSVITTARHPSMVMQPEPRMAT